LSVISAVDELPIFALLDYFVGNCFMTHCAPEQSKPKYYCHITDKPQLILIKFGTQRLE